MALFSNDIIVIKITLRSYSTLTAYCTSLHNQGLFKNIGLCPIGRSVSHIVTFCLLRQHRFETCIQWNKRFIINVLRTRLIEMNRVVQISTVFPYLLNQYLKDFSVCIEEGKGVCAKFCERSNEICVAGQMQF